MSLNYLSKRLDKLENQLNPKFDFLMVFTRPGESIEEAQLRVARENGFDGVPDDVFVFTINIGNNKND